MSKKRWHLKSIARILKSITTRDEESPRLSGSRTLNLDDFSRLLIQQIEVMDQRVKILERNFPIQEGRSHIDLLAHDQEGDLIIIWTPEILKAQRLLDLISQYDWMKKNVPLWQHLFPQAVKMGELRIKVWFFSAEMDSNLDTILLYLKGISLKIFQYSYRNSNNKLGLVIKPWMQTKTEAAPLKIPETRPNFQSNPEKAPHLRAVPPPKEIPAISQEEIKDLVHGLEEKSEVDFFDEDEITEPGIDINDLMMGKA